MRSQQPYETRTPEKCPDPDCLFAELVNGVCPKCKATFNFNNYINKRDSNRRFWRMKRKDGDGRMRK